VHHSRRGCRGESTDEAREAKTLATVRGGESGERMRQRAARGKQQAAGAAPGTASDTHAHLPTSTRKTFFIIAPLERDSSAACLDVLHFRLTGP
jgi:hypothetical protein